MKKITRIAFAAFASAIIIFEPQAFHDLLGIALKTFGEKSAKLEAKKK